MSNLGMAVEIYEKCNYQGRNAKIGYGNYGSPIDHIKISSIKVPAGFSVVLYEKLNFEGAKWVIQGPWNGQCLYTDNRWWADKAQSMKIFPTTSVNLPNQSSLMLNKGVVQPINTSEGISEGFSNYPNFLPNPPFEQIKDGQDGLLTRFSFIIKTENKYLVAVHHQVVEHLMSSVQIIVIL